MNQARYHDPASDEFAVRGTSGRPTRTAFVILSTGMHVLFIISLLAFAGLCWASLAAAQYIRTARYSGKKPRVAAVETSTPRTTGPLSAADTTHLRPVSNKSGVTPGESNAATSSSNRPSPTLVRTRSQTSSRVAL